MTRTREQSRLEAIRRRGAGKRFEGTIKVPPQQSAEEAQIPTGFESEQSQDPFINRPCDSKKSVRDAWQRAADKHGADYANDIFPDGKPTSAEAR